MIVVMDMIAKPFIFEQVDMKLVKLKHNGHSSNIKIKQIYYIASKSLLGH